MSPANDICYRKREDLQSDSIFLFHQYVIISNSWFCKCIQFYRLRTIYQLHNGSCVIEVTKNTEDSFFKMQRSLPPVLICWILLATAQHIEYH